MVNRTCIYSDQIQFPYKDDWQDTNRQGHRTKTTTHFKITELYVCTYSTQYKWQCMQVFIKICCVYMYITIIILPVIADHNKCSLNNALFNYDYRVMCRMTRRDRINNKDRESLYLCLYYW